MILVKMVGIFVFDARCEDVFHEIPKGLGESPFKLMENKSLWGKILNIVITVLTAIATTFGITSCMGV